MPDPDVAGAQALELLERIVRDDPIVMGPYDLEECQFCDGDVRNSIFERGVPYTRWAHHDADCPWALGRRLLGLPLERHTIANQVVDAAAVDRPRLELGPPACDACGEHHDRYSDCPTRAKKAGQ